MKEEQIPNHHIDKKLDRAKMKNGIEEGKERRKE